MSTRQLTPVERYWILVHAATCSHADLTEPRISAGAVLLALRELQAMRCLAADADGRLVPLGGSEGRAHVRRLLISTFDRRLSEKGWIEALCLSPTTRRLRPLLNELTAATARQLGIPVVRPSGAMRLMGRIDVLDRGSGAFGRAVAASLAWVTGSEDGCAEVLRMLALAEAKRPLSRIPEGARICEAIARWQGTDAWRSCDEAVSAVENARYMNATLSGAM